ncbi:MAG: SgcJ/EcaC family oxidoreductase [Pseudomonas farsensis]|uniref:SgcJ/EcaC family oxidoreductase n=1 Tax=Pseudomonas farsensis TaxID=2745492 RepID=UPI003C7D784E
MKRATLAVTLALLAAPALHAQTSLSQCRTSSAAEMLVLFDQWNAGLLSGDPAQVAQLYNKDAVLLPTLSPVPRLTHDDRLAYFEKFLRDGPSGKLDTHEVQTGCNEATAAGLYTFEFAATGQKVAARYTFTYRWDGQRWLISQHHSSLQPQG